MMAAPHLEILDSEMHDAFDAVLGRTLTDPATGLDVVIDGYDGPASLVLVVPNDFHHPHAEELEDAGDGARRVHGGEELWGPMVVPAQLLEVDIELRRPLAFGREHPEMTRRAG